MPEALRRGRPVGKSTQIVLDDVQPLDHPRSAIRPALRLRYCSRLRWQVCIKSGEMVPTVIGVSRGVMLAVVIVDVLSDSHLRKVLSGLRAGWLAQFPQVSHVWTVYGA